MYDLDGTEDEDTIDITPDFMKHDDPPVDPPDADATDPIDDTKEEKE